MPGKSGGQRSLAGYSPWGRKELDTTEYVCAHTRIFEHICESGFDETMDKAVRAKGNEMILYILTVEVQLGLRFSVPSCKVTISVFQALGSTGDIFF